MQCSTVKTLTQEEASEILSTAYFDRFAAKMHQSRDDFAKTYGAFLSADLAAQGSAPRSTPARSFAAPEQGSAQSLDAAFSLLTELASLTFSLYKWSVLLVNLKAGIYADMIFCIDLSGRDCFILEKNRNLVLADLHSRASVFAASSPKSHIAEILLFLYGKGAGAKMLELDAYSKDFDGSYLSFNQDLARLRMDYINFIDREFALYQNRLKQLQAIFLQNF